MERKANDKNRSIDLGQYGAVVHPGISHDSFCTKEMGNKEIDKIRRSFLWKGSEEANGGHCLVNWKKVRRPKKHGGLGVLDLAMFGRALRLRWLWYEWTDPEKPWVGTILPCNAIDRQLFRASTIVTVGNGKQAKFWQSSWLNGQAPMDIAPRLYKLAWRKKKKNCSRGVTK